MVSHLDQFYMKQPQPQHTCSAVLNIFRMAFLEFRLSRKGKWQKMGGALSFERK